MAVTRTVVRVDFPTDFTEIIGNINQRLQAEALDICEDIANDARATTAFEDYTGTPRESEYHKKKFPNARRLRPLIKAKISKFDFGGAIVMDFAPHAHLIEYGHSLVVHGRVVGFVAAHPYLGPPTESRIEEAIQRFAKEIEEELNQ